MKKVITILLSLFILIFIASCNKHSDTEQLHDILPNSDTAAEKSTPCSLTEWLLAEAGVENLENSLTEDPGTDRAILLAADNLQKTLSANAEGVFVWDGSAKTQAAGIATLIAAFELDENADRLETAKKASEALSMRQSTGGFLLETSEGIWIGDQDGNGNWHYAPDTYLLCMYALSALEKHCDDTSGFLRQIEDFCPQALLRFDRGDSFCVGIAPMDQINVRLINPYGRRLILPDFTNILLLDEVSGKKNTPIKKPVATDGNLEIAFQIPWRFDATREEWYVLEFNYWDKEPANVAVELCSNSGSGIFLPLRDGELLTDGTNTRRNWRVAIRPTELYDRADAKQAFAVKELLLNLSAQHADLENWAKQAETYYNMWYNMEPPVIVEQEPVVYPVQTWPNGAQLDENGVIVQRNANENTRQNEYGLWDLQSDPGTITYHPYLIAHQAMGINPVGDVKFYFSESYGGMPWVYGNTILSAEPAMNWLRQNYWKVNDSAVWYYNTDNSYSDLMQKAPWQSAYSQRYVMKAMQFNEENEMLLKAALAYQYPTSDGGLHSRYWKDGSIWYEEVPNNSHILNAHITSLVGLAEANEVLQDKRVDILYKEGLKSLIAHIAQYDTGYWTRYDSNPQKDLLFQIDWLEGMQSPLIESIDMVDPRDNTATQIVAGNDGSGYPNWAGIDWATSQMVDGRECWGIENGYLKRTEAPEGGTLQNAYFVAALPNRYFDDYFDMPTMYLQINYKDVAPGKFSINARSNNQGNRLDFTPLRGGILECVGDGEWKTTRIAIKPQTITNNMGVEYQNFHIEQTKKMAEKENSWYLGQYADKWDSYLKRWESDEPIVLTEPFPSLINITSLATVKNDDIMIEGYGLKNSLDGDPNDDYTAMGENYELPKSFSIAIGQPAKLYGIDMIFENEINYAMDYAVKGLNERGETVWEQKISAGGGKYQGIWPQSEEKISELSFTIYETSGQPRVLLRQITLWAEPDRQAPTTFQHWFWVVLLTVVILGIIVLFVKFMRSRPKMVFASLSVSSKDTMSD